MPDDKTRAMETVLRAFVGEANADDVLARWEEPHRKCHTRKHLDRVLSAFSADEPVFVLVCFYHDAVYIPGHTRNEEDSAALLASHADPEDPVVKDALRIIRSTAEFSHKDAPDEERFFLADCAVLRDHMPDLLEYEEEVRAEFIRFPEAAYVAGRTAFLDNAARVFPENAHELLILKDIVAGGYL